jgi:hypothetical protein
VAEPVHQLADADAKRLRTKCGLEIDRKYDKRSRVTIWWRDVTCEACEYKDLPENHSG